MPNKQTNNKKNRVARRNNPQPPLTFRPMPNMRVNLLFKQEKVVAETVAGAGAMNWYRVNGAFDPDQSAVGGSALGFNNYATLYNSYRVHNFRMRIEGLADATTAGNRFAVVTIMPNARQVTAPSDPALWGGEYKAVSTTVVPGTNGGRNVAILDVTYKPWDLMRITKQQYMADMDYASLVTTTPVLQAYVALGVNSLGTGSPMSLSAIVTISYEVEFFEPVVLT